MGFIVREYDYLFHVHMSVITVKGNTKILGGSA